MDEIAFFPTSIVGWITTLFALVLSIFTFLNRRNAVTDKERESLISILQDKNRVLESLEPKVEKLSAENEILKGVVLGKDEDSQDMRRKALEAMKQIDFLYGQKIEEMRRENIEQYVDRPRRKRAQGDA